MGIYDSFIGKLCVFRTSAYASGVHIGVLKEIDGDDAVVTDSRRLWRWRGANTLSEVAARGVDEIHSRISEPEPIKLILGVVEIIPVQDAARENLTRSRWGA